MAIGVGVGIGDIDQQSQVILSTCKTHPTMGIGMVLPGYGNI
jgi:hypothetical protein